MSGIDTIKELLRLHGYTTVSGIPAEERIVLRDDSGGALVIEKIASDIVTVAQEEGDPGDRVLPAIVFRVRPSTQALRE